MNPLRSMKAQRFLPGWEDTEVDNTGEEKTLSPVPSMFFTNLTTKKQNWIKKIKIFPRCWYTICGEHRLTRQDPFSFNYQQIVKCAHRGSFAQRRRFSKSSSSSSSIFALFGGNSKKISHWCCCEDKPGEFKGFYQDVRLTLRATPEEEGLRAPQRGSHPDPSPASPSQPAAHPEDNKHTSKICQ